MPNLDLHLDESIGLNKLMSTPDGITNIESTLIESFISSDLTITDSDLFAIQLLSRNKNELSSAPSFFIASFPQKDTIKGHRLARKNPINPEKTKCA